MKLKEKEGDNKKTAQNKAGGYTTGVSNSIPGGPEPWTFLIQP